jgi:hypothetical protein
MYNTTRFWQYFLPLFGTLPTFPKAHSSFKKFFPSFLHFYIKINIFYRDTFIQTNFSPQIDPAY